MRQSDGILGAVLLLAAATDLAAENWPQFRGPTGQGISSEATLPLHWSDSDHVAWKISIPGEVWSSPIVWNNRIFLTTATQGGVGCHVIAVDRATGQIVWDKEVFTETPGHKQQRNGYATPTPCTDGQRVYAVFGDGSFATLDFEGQVVWTNRDFKFYGEHGLGTSPILWHDLLIMARDGSGEPPETGAGWHSPWDRARILAWEARTGKLRWDYVYSKPHLFTINEGVVAMCLKGETGEIVWPERVGGNFSASPICASGRIYFLSDEGETTVIKAKPEFSILARNRLSEKCQASMGVSDDRLFIRTAVHLYCIR